MKENNRNLILKKACNVMDYFIRHADLSEETNFDLIFDGNGLTEEETEIVFEELHNIDSFEDIVNNENRIFSKNELDEMYTDLLLYSDNID